MSTALIAVLVKQLVQTHVAPTFGTPQHQSRVRHFRYMGIEAWRVPLIVALLPTLLHLSLFLFLVGLIILLFSLDYAIATVVTSIAILAYTIIVVTNLLPVWKPQCPYKTPLSAMGYTVIQTCAPALRKWINSICVVIRTGTTHQDHVSDEEGSVDDEVEYQTLPELESWTVQEDGCSLDAHALNWLCSMTNNPSVLFVITHSISDLPTPFSGSNLLRSGACADHVCSGLQSYTPWTPYPKLKDALPAEMTRYYIYVLAHMQLNPFLQEIRPMLQDGITVTAF